MSRKVRWAWAFSGAGDALRAAKVRAGQKLYSVIGTGACQVRSRPRSRSVWRATQQLRTVLVVAPNKNEALARVRAVHKKTGHFAEQLGVKFSKKCEMHLHAEEI